MCLKLHLRRSLRKPATGKLADDPRQGVRVLLWRTQLLVPDNLKAAVSRADRYEQVLNENYRKLARPYNTTVIPARPRKPKDKDVLVVERWFLMRLRHEVFHTLDALNLTISELLQDLNERPFRRLPGCRKSLYEKLDKPALKALPP